VSIQLPLRAQTTALLESIETADAPALDRLVPVLYDELREVAQRALARGQQNATIQTTELVHEAYLRLVDDRRVTGRGRAYFFGAAARAMRNVLVESARRRGAAKRGGGGPLVTLEEGHASVDAFAAELLDLEEALSELEARNSRQARVVECRYFGGMSVEETADALGVSARTVKSDWAMARAWLYARLRGEPGAPPP
jgi:RNA polymerase sigma factor (TIGR02999 family)